MFRLVCLCAMVLLVQGQRSAKAARYTDDPRVAAILSEERYLSGDGTFGAAYTQEDGVDFKEESDAAGNRKGSYSYVDPSGQRRTISYTAGKNGFVASGDHLPVGPAAPQAPAQAPRYQPAPQSQYQSAPQQQYQSAPQQQYQPAPQYSGQSSRGAPNEDDGQYYPELYENENSARSQYSGQARYTPVQQAAPQPQYQPAPQQQYSGVQQQSYVAPKVQNQYNTAPQQFSGVQSEPRPQQLFAPEERTPAPARFFPPGKLDLNRSPDGYSYSFSSKF